MNYLSMFMVGALVGGWFSYTTAQTVEWTTATSTPAYLLTATEAEADTYTTHQDILRRLRDLDERSRYHTKMLGKIINKI